MKYLKNYNIFKESYFRKDLKLPGIPDKFYNYTEAHDVIIKIFDTLKIKVDTIYNTDFADDDPFNVYCTYLINDYEGDRIKMYLMNTDDNNLSEFYIEEDEKREYFNDQIDNPMDLIDYLFEIGLVSIVPWLKKINESNDDDIMKDPNIDYKEKEVLMNKNSLDELNKYKSMKGRFDSIFSDLEKEIDSPTIFNLIDGNKFLKDYVLLLHKKRDLEVIKSMITDKEERIEELRKELQDLNLDSESDSESKDKLTEQISNLESEVKESKERISDYSDVPNLFQKWDNQIIKLTSDLKQGKSVLDSTLDDLR